MPFIGNQPAKVPLTSADITDGIITNADIANSTINLTQKVTGALPVANGGTGLTALGSSLQVLRTNTGATALEFATISTGATAGQVIQVVSATDSTERSTTSTSYVTASNTLSVSITPSATANKILILASSAVDAASDNVGFYTIYRNGSTNLGATNGFAMSRNGNVNAAYNFGINYLDSPSTTSALTYKIRSSVSTTSDGGSCTWQADSMLGSITLLEIGA